MSIRELEDQLLEPGPHASKATLVHVYIREAHASGEWEMGYNGPSAEHPNGLCYRQPKTMADRAAVARDMVGHFGLRGMIVCDAMDNALEAHLAACPDRLYVLRGDRVVFKGGQGPFLYSVPELLQFLEGK